MIDMNAEIRYAKESSQLINFAEVFRDVSSRLSKAYSVPEDYYAQSASISRFGRGVSINSVKEFLNHVHYDRDKAADIMTEFVRTRKLADIGVATGTEQLLNIGSDSKANGRSLTIAALAQRAARLESLLSPNGIPEAYATAQTQTRQALSFVEHAAKLAYDWNKSWGILTVDNAFTQARGTVTRQKVTQAAMAGILTLAGCSNLANPMDPISTIIAYEKGSPTATRVVPELTKTPTPTIEITHTVTPTEVPVLMPERPDNTDNLYTKEQMDAIKNGVFADQESALTDWTQNVWTQGENRAFPPGTAQLHFRYFFDPHRSNKGGVCLESASFPDFCIGIPTDSKGEQLPTPTAGYGPAVYDLTLDTETAKQIDSVNWQQLEGSTLGWRYNQWVRFKDGAAVATIGEGGTWVLADSESLNRLEITDYINEYLAGEGEYSEENLANIIFVYGSDIRHQKDDLGLFDVSPNIGFVQGIVLGEVKGDNCVWFFLGTKMGEDGERVVIPVKIPLEKIEYMGSVVFVNYDNRAIQDVPSKLLIDEALYLTDQQDVFNAVDTLINRPVMLDLWYNYPGDLRSNMHTYVLGRGGTEADAEYVYQAYTEMFRVQAASFCSFHPTLERLTAGNPNCGSGYSGVSITSEVPGFDDSWLTGDNNLSATVLTSYIDNK